MNLDASGLNQWAESKRRVECVRVLNREMDPLFRKRSGGHLGDEFVRRDKITGDDKKQLT